MYEENFLHIVDELMEKISNGENSCLDRIEELSVRYPSIKELKTIFRDLNNSFGVLRIVLQYLSLDLEATYREKAELLTKLGDME